MNEKNSTFITKIILLGFQVPQSLILSVFSILLLISGVAVGGNVLIIAVVSYSKILHSPMYFFLSKLSALDILLVMDIVPNMLYTVLAKETVIHFSACLAQFYFFVLLETLESLLLTVMSYDRYVAICKPLHYTLLMTNQVCWRMVIVCWILGILIVFNDILIMLKLQFCGPNVIDHFFCDLDPILKLSCTDFSTVHLEIILISTVVIIAPFCIIIVSYIYIIVTIFGIPSITGRKKVFSTCSSHLTVVSVFYGAIFGVYMVPRSGQLKHFAKVLSVFYTVVTPMMNPIIYSLRNKDLKDAIEQQLLKHTFK